MSRTLFRTRIKFCGLTRVGDVRLASELGADAIGFIFVADSRRCVRPADARVLRNALAPLVDAVAVFRDNPGDEVREVVKQLLPSLLQFHGTEDDAFCRGFGVPYIKAIAMGDGGLDGVREVAPVDSATALQVRYPAAVAFLFDSHGQHTGAGEGRSFDWSRLPTGLNKPFILAGGLKPDNVFDAISETLPWGVDVSTGIEDRPGIKDGDAMRRFVEEVRRADCHVDPDMDADTQPGVVPACG